MKKKSGKLIFLILTFLAMNAKAQTTDKTFDFWVGKWDAYWADSLKGTNKISKILEGQVVEENFSTNDGTFKGNSWSVYDSTSNLWKQTWVDNNGAYMTFTGGKENDKVILIMNDARMQKNKKYYMRMVFSDIKEDSFEWNWQSSEDKTIWKSVWTVHYKRADLKK